MSLSASFTAASQDYWRHPRFILDVYLGSTLSFCSVSAGGSLSPCLPMLSADELSSASQTVSFWEFNNESGEQTFKIWDDCAPGSTSGRWLANLLTNSYPTFPGQTCKLYMGFKGMTVAEIKQNLIFDGRIRDAKIGKDYVEITASTPQIIMAEKAIPENLFSSNSLILPGAWTTSYIDGVRPRVLQVNNLTEFTTVMAKMHNGAIALKIEDQWFLAIGTQSSKLLLGSIYTAETPIDYHYAFWGTDDMSHAAGAGIEIGLPFVDFTDNNTSSHHNLTFNDLSCQDIMDTILVGFGGFSSAGTLPSLTTRHQGHQPPLAAGRTVLDLLQDACQAFGVVPVWKGGGFVWAYPGYATGTSHTIDPAWIKQDTLDINLDDEHRITRCSVSQAADETFAPAWEWLHPGYDHYPTLKSSGPFMKADATSESNYGESRNRDMTLFFMDDPSPTAHSGANQLQVQDVWINAFKLRKPVLSFDLDLYWACVDILDRIVMTLPHYFGGAAKTYLVISRIILPDRVRIMAKQV